MKVIFYTATTFLDISLEIINILKKSVELHVLIEITANSKKRNIVSVENLPDDKLFLPPAEIMTAADYKNFAPYFDGAASVNFVVHSKKNLRSSLAASFGVWRFVKNIQPDVFHLEAMLVRSLGLIPAVFASRKLLITIHDPLPHSGEKDWKLSLTKFLFFHLPIRKGFFFYSTFAKQMFEEHYRLPRGEKYVIVMGAYSYFRKIQQTKSHQRNHILFFGRLSPYKGIDTLLKAMTEVFKIHPQVKLVIAGKSYKNYTPDQRLIEPNKEQIRIINEYIPNDALVSLISEAKFIVCPYTDATQSGVLMTAFALDKPVIASDTGALPEYIDHGVDGLIVPVNDPATLAKSILRALQDNYFSLLEQNISNRNKHNKWEENIPVILNAYLFRPTKSTN